MNETEFIKAFVPAYMAGICSIFTAHTAIDPQSSMVDARDAVVLAKLRFQVALKQCPEFFVDTRPEQQKETEHVG